MRYQIWDVLIFPGRSMIPLQEFKVACHVIPDYVIGETPPQQSSMLLLPMVTSFVQTLPPGEQFRISIHAWENPEPSRYACEVAKDTDLVMFEARVIVDGRLVGTKVFSRAGPWPAVLNNNIQIGGNSQMECLKFPVFHQELLMQDYWNAGDDLGRIKVLIAEGYCRDLLLSPLDRIKNVVGFSFQHAPLDILEASSIAWPNDTMWREIHLPQFVSPRHINSTGAAAHSHSPRPRMSSGRSALLPHMPGSMPPPGLPVPPRVPLCNISIEPIYQARKTSSTDMSMPDYSKPPSLASNSRRATDPLMTDKPERRYDNLQSPGAYESICAALSPPASENTVQDE